MADMLDSLGVLNPEKLRKIFKSEDDTASSKEKLMEELGWSSFEDDDDLRRAAILDFVDETLKFAVERGLSWPKSYQFLDICVQILKNIGTDVSQIEIVEVFKRILFENPGYFLVNELKSLTDYVFVAILQHIKLFEYVLNIDREPLTIRLERQIDTPESAPPTSSGLTKKIFDYNEKVKLIEMRKAKLALDSCEKERAQSEKLRTHDEDPAEFKDLESSTLNRELIEQIVQECMQEHGAPLKELMTSQLNGLQEQLLLELEKAELPRPRELGPRSPVPMRSPKSTRSPKSRSPKGSAKEKKGSAKERKGSGKDKKTRDSSRPVSKTKLKK